MRAPRLLALAGALLAACAGTGRTVPTAPAGEAAPPPGAIPIGEELYMVPLDEPVAGCRAYRLYSPTKMVTQAIHFRDARGGFTMDRSQAVCE